MALIAGTEVSQDHFIGGERVGSAERFLDVSPIDESPLGLVARGGQREARAAVDAALDAFGGWGKTTRGARAACLRAMAEGIEARIGALSAVETEDNGSLLRSHVKSVMPRVAENFRFFAGQLEALGREDFSTRGHRNHVDWDPAGVVAIVTPWNAPLMLASWRVAPALAAGDTVVLKPAEWAPLTASLLADVATDAGLPPGVLNVVQGVGEEVGDALVSDERLARIAFTGSADTARRVAAHAAASLVPVSFELGGKSPLVVFEDADLDLAVDLSVGQFDNAGQVCLAGTRLLVHERVYDTVVERIVAGGSALRQGDPRDPATEMGPLISRAHFERVDGFVRRAVAGGATPVLGGGPNAELGGLYYLPTLLADAAQGSEILTEEVFGPVLTVQSFGTEEEAIELANSTRYGLAATIVTRDEERAAHVAGRLVAGTVWVNCFFVRDLRAPFGGSRKSGIGREGGDWSFDFYCDVKNAVFAPSESSRGVEGER